MKQRYEKPQIYMESFEISSFIAASCAQKLHAIDTCTLEDEFGSGSGDNSIIYFGNAYCNYNPELEEDHNGICYNTPTADNAYFGS